MSLKGDTTGGGPSRYPRRMEQEVVGEPVGTREVSVEGMEMNPHTFQVQRRRDTLGSFRTSTPSRPSLGGNDLSGVTEKTGGDR